MAPPPAPTTERPMKRNALAPMLALAPLALALAGCGSTDDASTEAEADTVEMTADAALDDVTVEPAADAEANAVEAATEDAEASAAEAGANAADVAARAQAAAAAADDETEPQ